MRAGDYDCPCCHRCGAEIAFLPAEGYSKPVMCDAGIVPFWPGREARILTPEGTVVWGRLTGRPKEISGAGRPLHAETCPARRGAQEWKK